MSSKENIIFEIAKRSELVDNFKDIKVFSQSNNWNSNDDNLIYAFTDTKKRILYLNNRLNESQILPLCVHEVGHLDKRLKSPKGMEDFYFEMSKDNEEMKQILNYVFDMNIHMKYSKMIPNSYNILLRKFLTEQRNRIYENDSDNLILALEYPKTQLQKQVRTIMFDKNMRDYDKAKRILKLIKKKQKEGQGKGKSKGGCKGKQGQGQSQSNGYNIGNLTYTETKVILDDKERTSISRKSESIKNDITEIRKTIDELKNKIASMGFSNEQGERILNIIKTDNIEYFTKNLERVKDMFVLAEKTYTKIKEKNKKNLKDYGKMIGYRRMKDVNDLIRNPIDTLLLSDYDLNDIRIPKFQDNKQRTTNLVVIRDTSGSLSDEPINSIVRDLVVSMIQLSKKSNYKVGVIEFDTNAEVIYQNGDSKDEIGNDYQTLILQSLFNKYGGSTNLSLAIKKLNNIIEKYNLTNEHFNVVIITDRETDEAQKIKVNDDKLKLIVLTTENRYSNYLDSFEKFMKLHKNTKTLYIRQFEDDNKKGLMLENLD